MDLSMAPEVVFQGSDPGWIRALDDPQAERNSAAAVLSFTEGPGRRAGPFVFKTMASEPVPLPLVVVPRLLIKTVQGFDETIRSRAWYWVAKWVCKAWYWVAKWVCKAFAWVVKAVCVAFSWFLQLVCVAWDWLRCAILALLRAIAGLFGRASRGPRVEHVFVLVLENRSFDHMFGLSGLTGIGVDGKPTTVDGADAARDSNVDPATGVAFPVGPGADFALKGIDEDPGHEFEDTVVALCGDGAAYPASHVYPTINNSGFIANYRHSGSSTPERIMRCFEPAQLPVLTKLAREYAICDNWFSSLPGPTWPNRFFALAASSGGLDGSPSPADIVFATTIEGYRFSNGNIFDLLDDYCIEWRIFEGDEFPVSFALSGMNLNALQGRFTDFDEFATELSNPGFAPKFVFIEPKYGAHGFDVTGPGDFTCGNSMHPLDDVTRGEQLVKTVYESIRNSPHWDTSLLIITFDEHGGFYDHVKPPAATPPGDVVTSSYVQHGFTFGAGDLPSHPARCHRSHPVRPHVDARHRRAPARDPQPDQPGQDRK